MEKEKKAQVSALKNFAEAKQQLREAERKCAAEAAAKIDSLLAQKKAGICVANVVLSGKYPAIKFVSLRAEKSLQGVKENLMDAHGKIQKCKDEINALLSPLGLKSPFITPIGYMMDDGSLGYRISAVG